MNICRGPQVNKLAPLSTRLAILCEKSGLRNVGQANSQESPRKYEDRKRGRVMSWDRIN